MNERIRELIKSCGIIPEDEHYEVAELIVKKCADIVQFLQDHGREDIADDLKKHFGVE